MIKKVTLILTVSILWVQPVAAGMDAMELALLQPYQNKHSLRWDNSVTEPFWLNDETPVYFPQWKMQGIRLQSGQQNRFYLPAYESLRLYNPERRLQANDITVYLSNGSGLLAEATVQTSTDRHSLIISPQVAKPLIVHVGSTVQQTENIELAVFVSRHQRFSSIAPYRNLKWLSGHWAWLSKKPMQIPEIYWLMQPQRKQFVNITGPARILIKNRLHYETQAAELIQDYRIRYRLDDSSPLWLDFATGAESNRIIFVNTQMETLGREQQAYIEIPAGHHRLELMSDRNLYLQVLEQSEDDYLLPMLNQQPLSVQTVRKQGLMAEQKLPEINALAQDMIRDNSRKSSALIGHQLLKQAALQRMDYPAGLAEAEKLKRHRTFYRNLLPGIKKSPGNQFNAYFIKKKLRAIRRPQRNAVVAQQHQSASLNRLGNAYFSPVVTAPDNYSLPERHAPSMLRIIADKRQCKERRFNIQMDEQPPQSLLLRCQDVVSSDDTFVRSPSETALLNLQEQSGESGNKTLGHLFAANYRPAEMIPAAIHEIVLPQQVRQLKVWCDDNEQHPLNLALQISAAKPYQFSEQSYLARLHNLQKPQLFKLLIEDLSAGQNTNSPTEQQLQNEWKLLNRFIVGLSRHYRSSVADKIPVKLLAAQSQLQNWRKQALQAEQQQQWIEALTHWNRIVEASQGKVRDRAQFAQATILMRLSENYLAKSLWRYLSLYAQPEIAKQAETQLLAIYRRQHDIAAIKMLAATMFSQRPDQHNLKFLLETLIENQEYRFALLLGLILDEPPLELMLKAAYHLNWWQSYHQLLTRLPDSRQAFWTGLKAQKHGDYQTAMEAWQKAGTDDTDSWALKLQQGLAIRKQLSESHNISLLYRNWSQWQQTHPGGSIWQDASQLVKDATGTDQYYALERDLYSKAFRGTTRRPVKLRVMGPVNLNFKVRLLHGTADSRLDGMLRISDNREQLSYPFSNNRPVQGMALVANNDFLPGNLFSVEYQVGQGIHEIELSSNDAPISVSISKKLPELSLTVLAPLQLDTFTHAISVSENQLKKLIPVKPSTSMAIADKDLTLEALQQLRTVENAEQAETRMIQYLVLLERQKEGRDWLLFAAEQLQQQFPENETVQALWNRISRYSQWQMVHSIVSSAGLRFVDTVGWQPASPALSVRKALISKTNPDEHVVFSDHRLLLMMTNLAAKTVHTEVLLDDPSFLQDSPAQMQYQIDDQKPQSLVITRSEGWKKLRLRVPEGHHQLRFWVAKPVSNQFLKLRFQDHVSDLNVTQERSFFVSTRMEPLQIHVKGPAMIRIEEWLDGKIASRYHQVGAGWQLLTLPPRNKHQESLLQVKRRVATDKAKPAMNRIVKRKLEPVAAPAMQIKDNQALDPVKIVDFFKLGRQEDGTWSLGTDLVRRNNVQEDSDRGNPEHFQQFSLNHRYFDEYRNLYWNTQGFVRARERGGPSLGISESVYIKPDTFPFTINLEAKIVSQIVHKDPEWLGQFKMAISQMARITPTTSVLPKLSWFGRHMSVKGNEMVKDGAETEDQTFKEKLDQDIFTDYKAQHTSGLSASMLFIHDPWLDTRWTAKIKTVSNENMNFFNPDYFSTEAHWKQLLGDVSLDAGYRISFFQEDKDRRSSIKRHATKLILNWQAWTNKLNRFEISGQYNYDIDRKAHLGMLSFSYHFGEGRGYRDFKPGAIDFRQIRELQSLDENY